MNETKIDFPSTEEEQEVKKYSLVDILIFFLVLLFFESILYFLFPAVAPLLVVLFLTFCFVLVLLLWVLKYRKWTRADLGLTNLFNAKNNWTGIGLGFLMAFVFIGLDTNTVYLFFHQPNLTFISLLLLILLLPFLTVVSPIDEIVYRGFLFSLFRNRINLFWGIILSSLFFALAHRLGSGVESIYSIKAIGFLHKFVLGVIFAFFFDRTKSLSGPMLAHIVYNWCAVTVYLIAYNTG